MIYRNGYYFYKNPARNQLSIIKVTDFNHKSFFYTTVYPFKSPTALANISYLVSKRSTFFSDKKIDIHNFNPADYPEFLL